MVLVTHEREALTYALGFARRRQALSYLAAGAVFVRLRQLHIPHVTINLFPAGFGDHLVLGLLRLVVIVAGIALVFFAALCASAD